MCIPHPPPHQSHNIYVCYVSHKKTYVLIAASESICLNLEDRGSRIEDRGSRIEDRGSRIEDRGSRIGDRGSGIEEKIFS